MSYEVKPPLDEALLAHYGVMGMKWGKHKAKAPLTVSYGRTNRTPTKDEILSARKTQKGLQAQVKTLDKKVGKVGKNPFNRKVPYTPEHQKLYDKLLEGDARVISKYKTRGEQAVGIMLGGPIGALVVSNNRFRVRSRLANQRA